MKPARSSILLADDDRIDTKAFLRALAKLGAAHSVSVARDGQEAWEMLSGEAGLRPDLIVLDINMPRMSGLELLRRIREEDGLRETPVFVLTTSDEESDRLDALKLQVAGYIVKSELVDGLSRALGLLVAACAAPTVR
jgi:CheY-like chemotaxis protein